MLRRYSFAVIAAGCPAARRALGNKIEERFGSMGSLAIGDPLVDTSDIKYHTAAQTGTGVPAIIDTHKEYYKPPSPRTQIPIGMGAHRKSTLQQTRETAASVQNLMKRAFQGKDEGK
jgi:hypothetical protein